MRFEEKSEELTKTDGMYIFVFHYFQPAMFIQKEILHESQLKHLPAAAGIYNIVYHFCQNIYHLSYFDTYRNMKLAIWLCFENGQKSRVLFESMY